MVCISECIDTPGRLGSGLLNLTEFATQKTSKVSVIRSLRKCRSHGSKPLSSAPPGEQAQRTILSEGGRRVISVEQRGSASVTTTDALLPVPRGQSSGECECSKRTWYMYCTYRHSPQSLPGMYHFLESSHGSPQT